MSLFQFLIKAKVYFNRDKSPIELKLLDDITSLANLTPKLNELQPDIDNRRVRKIKFRDDWIGSNGRVKYNLFELKTSEEVTTMRKSFCRRITKEPIKSDAQILRFVDDIIKMLKRAKSSSST